MPSFSERYGLVEPRQALGFDEMPDDYRTMLWNIIYAEFGGYAYGSDDSFGYAVWIGAFKDKLDEMPETRFRILTRVKDLVLTNSWNRVYDLLERILRRDDHPDEKLGKEFSTVMAQHQAPYRVVEGRVLRIDEETDAEAVTEALDDLEGLPAAKRHLTTSLTLLTRRDKPEYGNSVKEAISAVESVAQVITGKRKTTLSDALKELKRKSAVPLHAALLDGWIRLYGYANDDKGIRHAASDEQEVSQAEARYWLVTCSAFVSLLVKEAMDAGIDVMRVSPDEAS